MIEKSIFLISRKLPIIVRNILQKNYVLFLKIKHFIQYKSKENMFEFINIETHTNCNRKCSYCPNSKFKQANNKLKFSTIFRILDDLIQINFKGFITITGFNEPMLDNRFKKIIQLIRYKLPHNKIIVYSNGDFLTNSLLSFLKEKKIILHITLHKPLNKNIEKIVKKNKNPYFRVRKNIDENILSTRGGLVEVRYADKRKFCIIPITELTINSYGNVILCSDDFFGKTSFGNVNEKNIMEIWKNKKFKKIRDNIYLGKINLPICKKCLEIY